MEIITSDQYDGKKRNLYPKHCIECNVVFYRPKHVLLETRYCSKDCQNAVRSAKSRAVCGYCKEVFHRAPKRKGNRKILYCSSKCLGASRVKYSESTPTSPSLKDSPCAQCSSPRNSKGTGFCSRKCFEEWEYNSYISAWKCGEIDGTIGYGRGTSISSRIRRHLIASCGGKCSKCGWCELNPTTNKSPLTIDHIDGNSLTSTVGNLRLLCPNCHALTATYCGLNKGNGRGTRPQTISVKRRIPKPYSRPASKAIRKPRTTKCNWPTIEQMTKWVSESPLEAIAKSLGVSGVSVWKWCKIRQIATPLRGYWAKKRAGKI